MILSYTAAEQDEGRKVYSILRHELKLTSTAVKRLKNAGGILLNGKPDFTTRQVLPGDVVAVDTFLAERDSDIIPEEGNISILYENEAFLVLNKPCGMIVHPSRARQFGSLAGFAAGYLEKKGKNDVCHVVNRLDRDTSGIVIIAKSAHYKTLLSAALSDECAEKEYTGIVCGEFEPSCGVIDVPIKRVEERKMLRVPAPDGQRAVTRYETVGTADTPFGRISLVKFILETGRTHQIRVHSLYMNSPLLGDTLYYTNASAELSAKLSVTAQALHAGRIRFRDPLTEKLMELTAPFEREDMNGIIEEYFENPAQKNENTANKDFAIYEGITENDSWHGYGFKNENVHKIDSVSINGRLSLREYGK